MWFLKLMILDIYIHPWLLRDNSQAPDETVRGNIYVPGCLDACTVAVHRVQRGCICTSLARKGLNIGKNLLRLKHR